MSSFREWDSFGIVELMSGEGISRELEETCQFTSKLEDGSNCMEDEIPHSSNSDVRHITGLPPEVMNKILRYLKFENIAKLRSVSKRFNSICSFLLNTEFNHLRTTILLKFQALKALMPRRESARKKHPLARESDIIETLHMRLSLLHMSFGKHIERKYCCFFPGEIIDEVYNILQYIKSTTNLNRAFKVTDELFDLSTMAMEYFKEHIEPTLPEISYLTTELLDQSTLIPPPEKAEFDSKRADIDTMFRYPFPPLTILPLPPSFTVPSADLTINKSQLLSLECSNTIQDILVKPTTDHLDKFRKQLKKTKQIATKNRKDIVKMKHSLETAKKRITAAVKELHLIKCLRNNDKEKLSIKNSNASNFSLEVKEEQQEASYSSDFLSPNLKTLDAMVCKNDVSCDNILKKISKDHVKRTFDIFAADTSSQNEANLANNLSAETDNQIISMELMDENLPNTRKSKKKKNI